MNLGRKSTFLLFFSLFIVSACCKHSIIDRDEVSGQCDCTCFPAALIHDSPYFLVILVDAPRLNYSGTLPFLQSVACRAQGSLTGRFGHAWIYLSGRKNGMPYVLEGGHSGELGVLQPTYFDGIMNYNIWGYANPTREQKREGRYEQNPVKYLWDVQKDGFFQAGSGGHKPTFAAKIAITPEQFEAILEFIKNGYAFKEYSLTGNQCSSFVSQAASLAGFPIDARVSVPIEKKVYFRGRIVRLRTGRNYSEITFPTPDLIEEHLIKAVRAGTAKSILIP